MYCQNKIMHTVQSGDSLYRIARQYQTTVTELILGNPGVNPYNLQVGMQLVVCPGDGYEPPQMNRPGQNQGNMGNMGTPGMQGGMGNMGTPGMQGGMGNMGMPGMPGGPGNMGMPGMPGGPGNTGSSEDMDEEEETGEERMTLQEDMRMAWLNHVFWTRMYLMSADTDAKDRQAVEERLLETADEITDVFANYLPINATRQLRNLLVEHIEIAGQMIAALKVGNTADYDNLTRSWYANANQLATLLASQNPYFDNRETRNMLLNHLDLLRQQIEQQIRGDYQESIDTFRDIEDQAITMADFFARGLMAR